MKVLSYILVISLIAYSLYSIVRLSISLVQRIKDKKSKKNVADSSADVVDSSSDFTSN